MNTFNDFREKISIAEMAEKLGYWKNPSGGSSYLSYCLGDTTNPTDEIIIYNPGIPAKNTYFSRKGGVEDKGNLINFVMNRLDRFSCTKTGFSGVNEVLSSYLGSELKVTAPISSQMTQAQSEIKFNIHYWQPRSLDSTGINYLTTRRKLSTKTINDFRSKYFCYTVGKSGHVGFPFRKPGQMDITNFEMRNYFPDNNVNYKAFCTGGDKSSSCWIANFVPYDKVTDVYLFESAIDAMSFYEMKGFSKETTSTFISTGGHVTKGQIAAIKTLFPNVNYHCCNDNDASGNCFDIATAHFLKGEECKTYTAPLMPGSSEKAIHISLSSGISESFHEKDFSSVEYAAKHDLNNIDIIKPERGKDWNELLVSYKRFDLNLSPTVKVNNAISSVVSQLNLRGYNQLADDILAKQNYIADSILQKSDYIVTSPLAETEVYTMIAKCKLTTNDNLLVPEITDMYIVDKVTQKTLPGKQVIEFFNKENINICRNFFSEDIKRFLEKKSLSLSVPVERRFEGAILPSGWHLKEICPLKIGSIETGNCL